MTSGIHRALSPARLRLIAALLVISAVLFLVGSAVERGWGSGGATTAIHQEAGAPQAVSEGEGTHTQVEENAEASEVQAHSEATEPTIAGIDLESPWIAALVVLLTVLLIGALWRFGFPVLFVVLIVAVLATVVDVREIVVQAGLAQYGVAVLAAAVAVAHLATVIVTVLALRQGRTSVQTPAAST